MKSALITMVLSLPVLVSCSDPKWSDNTETLLTEMCERIWAVNPSMVGNEAGEYILSELAQCLTSVAVSLADTHKCPLNKDESMLDQFEKCYETNKKLEGDFNKEAMLLCRPVAPE